MSTRLGLALLASLLCTSTTMAQSSVPVKPAQNRTLATPPPPPPPDKRANPPGRNDTPKCGTAGGPPCETAVEPSVDAEPAATTPAPRIPAGVGMAQRPQTAAPSKMHRELMVASADVAEADAQRAWLVSRGAQLLRRRTLGNLGWVLSVFRLPPEWSPATLSKELTSQWPSALPEINQRFAALAGNGTKAPAEYARALIGWPANCPGAARIAMLDGPVNPNLASLADRRIGVTQIAPATGEPDYRHGTALAVLLLGRDAPRGLLPDAELMVGVIMSADEEGAYTTTEWILHGLDWVLGLEPRPMALNLSFGGPRSAQLRRGLDVVTQAVPVAAAVGNEGQKAVAFPASHPGVIAVTAVDARGRRWPRANTGDQVAIAAPGVEVWTLDGAGRGHYANGTSIATLFVAASLAMAPPDPGAIEEWLAAHAAETGSTGRNPEYGHGVLALRGNCRRTPA